MNAYSNLVKVSLALEVKNNLPLSLRFFVLEALAFLAWFHFLDFAVY